MTAGVPGIVTEDLTEIRREESLWQYNTKKDSGSWTKYTPHFRKHGFFEELTCKTPSDFKFTLVYLGRLESENQNLRDFEFSRRPFYDIMRINVLFLNSLIAKLLNT